MMRTVAKAAALILMFGNGFPPCAFADAEAEEELLFEIVDDEGWDRESYANDERGINSPTAETVERGSLLVLIMHRARKSFTDDACRDYFGFDAGGLKIGLGLRYGLLDRMDFGLLRLNGTAETFDTYEFDLRYRFLDQETNFFDTALRSGISWFPQHDEEDAMGSFWQLLATRGCGRRFRIGTGLLYHTESSSDRKSTEDNDESMAVLGLIELRLMPRLAWTAELAGNISGYGEKEPAFSTSLKLFTFGHTFSLVVSNTQYVGADGLVANAWRTWDDLILGFNITRLIEL